MGLLPAAAHSRLAPPRRSVLVGDRGGTAPSRGVDMQPRGGLLRGGDGGSIAAARAPPVVECVRHARGRGDSAAVAAWGDAAAGHSARAKSPTLPKLSKLPTCVIVMFLVKYLALPVKHR